MKYLYIATLVAFIYAVSMLVGIIIVSNHFA